MRKTRSLEVRRWGLIPKPASGQGEASVSVTGGRVLGVLSSWASWCDGRSHLLPGTLLRVFQVLIYAILTKPPEMRSCTVPPCSSWRTNHRWLCCTTWTEWLGSLSKVTQLVSIRVGFEPRVDVFYPFNKEQSENWQAAPPGEVCPGVVLHSWHTCTSGGLVQQLRPRYNGITFRNNHVIISINNF